MQVHEESLCDESLRPEWRHLWTSMCSQYNMFEVYMPRNRAVVLRWPRAKHGPDQQLGSMVAEDAVYNGS